MNVALVTKSMSRLAGGVVEAMRPSARLLSDRFDVDVVALGIEDKYSCSDAALWAPVTSKTFKCRGPHSIGYSPELDRYLSATSFDLVHTHGLFYYTSASVVKWSGRHNRPYVISPHGMLDDWALENSRLKKRLFAFLCEDNHLGRARCVHALCDAEVRSIRKYGLKNPVCRIPNGVDMPRDVPSPAPPWDEKAVGGKKVLLYLGRIHPKKGLPVLLDAWFRIQGQVREAGDWYWSLSVGIKRDMRTP